MCIFKKRIYTFKKEYTHYLYTSKRIYTFKKEYTHF